MGTVVTGEAAYSSPEFVLLALVSRRQGAFIRLMGTFWFHVREVITFLT